MDTPEYIQIIRRQLVAWRAASQAQRDAAPTLAPEQCTGEGSEQNEQNEQIAPAQTGSGPASLEARKQIASKSLANSFPPAADVAAMPGALASGRRDAHPSGWRGSAASLPANWQELDPHAYQPRPFGPMETDPDWPGDQEEDAPPRPTQAGGDAGATSASPTEVGAVASAIDLASTLIRQVDARGGLAIAPPSGDPLPDLEDTCWLCEDAVEFYDHSGQAWCSLCIEEAGKSEGWQDLVDLLPATWKRREESHKQLAVYAAAHYHGADRPRITLRWSQPPFHQTLKGADLFRAFAERLASPHRWLVREAERQLERLVEHQGRGV